MSENKKTLSPYEPYNRESIYNICRDAIGVMLLTILVAASSPSDTLIIALGATCLFFVGISIDCRISLCVMIEKKGEGYISSIVNMVKITEDITNIKISGNIITRLYPKNLEYNRFVITCINEDGTEIRLRCAFPSKSAQILYDNICHEGWKRKVTYGKLSKIIVSFDDKDDEAFVLTHRLNRYVARKHINCTEPVSKPSSGNFVEENTKKQKHKANKKVMNKHILEEVQILSLLLILFVILLIISIKQFNIILLIIEILLLAFAIRNKCLFEDAIMMPIDLITGKKQVQLYSPKVSYSQKGIIYQDIMVCFYPCYTDKESYTFKYAVASKDLDNIEFPPERTLIEVTYYPWTKYIIEWKVIEDNNVQ